MNVFNIDNDYINSLGKKEKAMLNDLEIDRASIGHIKAPKENITDSIICSRFLKTASDSDRFFLYAIIKADGFSRAVEAITLNAIEKTGISAIETLLNPTMTYDQAYYVIWSEGEDLSEFLDLGDIAEKMLDVDVTFYYSRCAGWHFEIGPEEEVIPHIVKKIDSSAVMKIFSTVVKNGNLVYDIDGFKFM